MARQASLSKTSLPVRPNAQEAESINYKVSQGLRARFPAINDEAEAAQAALYEAWSAAGLPEIRPDFLWVLWTGPVQALCADQALFFLLPAILGTPSQQLYQGSWLDYWNVLEQTGFAELCPWPPKASSASAAPTPVPTPSPVPAQPEITMPEIPASRQSEVAALFVKAQGYITASSLDNLIKIRFDMPHWMLIHGEASYAIMPGEWHAATEAALKGLWQDPRLSSYTQAAALGFFARDGKPGKNAIVGKAHRLGLPGRPSPIQKSADGATRQRPNAICRG